MESMSQWSAGDQQSSVYHTLVIIITIITIIIIIIIIIFTIFIISFTPVSDKLIPTGSIASVAGTVFDLRTPTRWREEQC